MASKRYDMAHGAGRTRSTFRWTSSQINLVYYLAHWSLTPVRGMRRNVRSNVYLNAPRPSSFSDVVEMKEERAVEIN